jgi:hypothetical protein
LISQKKEEDKAQISKLVNLIGASANKQCHYKLFKNIDESKVSQKQKEQYKLNDFRHPAVDKEDALARREANLIFAVSEGKQGLAQVPRK